MTENEKKKPDYSNSAENLCNPPEVGRKIMELQDAQSRARTIEADLQKNETYLLLKGQEEIIADITAQIKDMVDTQGSYQDIESGFYAVKYRRMIKEYHVDPFLEKFPKFAPIVVQQVINTSALQGQIKGKLLTEEELKEAGVITETPTYAYYIR